MRSDYVEKVAKYDRLKLAFDQARKDLGALDSNELRLAIEEPARRVGLRFVSGITEDLIGQIKGEVASLPLLQFALLELWTSRERNRVTWEKYREMGSVPGALARSADAFYAALLPQDQARVKWVFLRLVRLGEGLEIVSKRVRRESLYQRGGREGIEGAISKLAAARLVRITKEDVPEDVQVEVAHEALIRNWPRLMEWLEDERVRMRQRLRLTAAADDWKEHDKDPRYNFTGRLLDEALLMEDLEPLETEFVQASEEARLKAQKEKADASRSSI